jgi:dolichyl-phosphate beta-glucosyltransferase
VIDEGKKIPYLSIIIPAYNEERRIGRTLKKTLKYLRKQNYAYELIVVDDGSRDKTSEAVRSFIKDNCQIRLIAYPENAGKGKAVRTGINDSKGEFVLFMDADYSTPIEELEEAFALVDREADIAIGSRGIDPGTVVVKQPYYRKIGSRIFNLIAFGWLSLSEFKDTQCGFKLFRGEVARQIFSIMRVDGYMFDVESLYLAKKMGYTIKEFPVRWTNDPSSKLRIFYDTARMFKHLAQIRFGNYPIPPTPSLPISPEARQ